MRNSTIDREFRTIVAGDIYSMEDYVDEPEEPSFAKGDRVRLIRTIPTQHGELKEGTWLTVESCWFDMRGERITLTDERMRIVVNDADSECVSGF